MDLTKAAFFSGNNYMKRSEFVGSQSVSLTTSGGGPLDTETITINHNLGYIPQYRVYGDFVSGDSALYPAFTNAYYPSQNWVDCFIWVTTTQLVIQIWNTPDTNRTVNVYWVIYYDYGSAT